VRIVFGNEAQFAALIGWCVAERTHAVEFVGEHPLNRCGSPLIRMVRIGGRHGCVVELKVGEQRAVVAGRALCLAEEQMQAGFLGGR